LYQLFDAALTANDRSGGALLAGRLHDNLNSMAKLTGQLSASPLISNTMNIFVSPQFAELETTLVRALAKHPQARADLIRALRELEDRATSSGQLLEHDSEEATP
jgi:hypothetical protein